MKMFAMYMCILHIFNTNIYLFGFSFLYIYTHIYKYIYILSPCNEYLGTTIPYHSLWFPEYFPPKNPDEIISLAYFSFQIYIAELSTTQSDIITCSDFTTRRSPRIAFLTWISDCITTCRAALSGELCPWILDLVLSGLWRFGDCDIRPAPDARFCLHKLPQPNFNCNSAKFPSENFCDLLKIKVSLSDTASC